MGSRSEETSGEIGIATARESGTIRKKKQSAQEQERKSQEGEKKIIRLP